LAESLQTKDWGNRTGPPRADRLDTPRARRSARIIAGRRAAQAGRRAWRLAKVFWFFFSKKNRKNKDFFLKKEAKTLLCFRCVAWLARVVDSTQGARQSWAK